MRSFNYMRLIWHFMLNKQTHFRIKKKERERIEKVKKLLSIIYLKLLISIILN